MDESGAAVPDRENRWNLLATIILSCATLASAWCGFQASSWGSVATVESRTASTQRMEASRQSAIADRQLSSDLLLFTAWVDSTVSGSEAAAQEIERRFLPHFLPAFEAWRTQPVNQGRLPDGSPFDLAEYVLPTQQLADEATARAEAAIERADAASAWNGRYVLATVLFASVLFLAGIAAKLSQPRLFHGVVVLAGLMLLGALVSMFQIPIKM